MVSILLIFLFLFHGKTFPVLKNFIVEIIHPYENGLGFHLRFTFKYCLTQIYF